jgi:hypothetical protein
MQKELGYGLDFKKVSMILNHNLKELFGFTFVEGDRTKLSL